jgi:hypothetical protein
MRERALSHSTSRPPTADTARVATAYHEAGHAVACLALQRRFRRVSIRAGKDFAGALFHRREVIARRARLHERGYLDFAGAIIAAAGFIAEKRKTGRRNLLGAESDLRTLVDIARGAGRDGCGAPESSPRVRALTRAACAEAELLMARYWEAVERVAIQLLERETLSYNEAERAFFPTA